MIKSSFTGYLECLVCDHDNCDAEGLWINKFEDGGPTAVTWGLDNGWRVEPDKDDLCPKCLANCKGQEMITDEQQSDIRLLAKEMDVMYELGLPGSLLGFRFPNENKAKAFVIKAGKRWEMINFDDAYRGGMVGVLYKYHKVKD